jgi:hypothetical protein
MCDDVKVSVWSLEEDLKFALKIVHFAFLLSAHHETRHLIAWRWQAGFGRHAWT